MLLNFIRGNILTIFAGVLLFGPFLFCYYLLGVLITTPFRLLSSPAPDPYFHLLLPATAKNEHVCKLMLSGRILGYPDPVFVGWEEKGQYNGTESHLFKISETLAYLKSLPQSSDNDMVLVLDAYDVWLQLRPDVLINRYNAVLERADERLQNEHIHGKIYAGADVRSSIVFGADKACAPQRRDEPACWAVPESTFAADAFGPDTDSGSFELARPRWLNSGTIMGPARHMREMFSATMDMLSVKDSASWEGAPSDQFYFAEVFAEQELSRSKLRNASFEAAHPDLPPISESKRTEYHITLDYESELFQIVAGYQEHITWMRFNDTTPASRSHSPNDGRMPRLDELNIPADIKRSDAPFTGSNGEDGLPFRSGWPALPLGVNTITGSSFPVMHMTSDKGARERWWRFMWYQGTRNYVDKLLTAAASRMDSKREYVFVQADGVNYRLNAARIPEFEKEMQGGAWTNMNEFLAFDDVCDEFSDALYGGSSDRDAWLDVGFDEYAWVGQQSEGENEGEGEGEGQDQGSEDFAADEFADESFAGENFEIENLAGEEFTGGDLTGAIQDEDFEFADGEKRRDVFGYNRKEEKRRR